MTCDCRICRAPSRNDMVQKPTICFASYELYPTTRGGAGILIHHAAECLLNQGHHVVFLLDIPEPAFMEFVERDRLSFPHPELCRGYRIDSLCNDFPYSFEEIGNHSLWKSLRFAHAFSTVLRRERIDFTEFHDFCGLGYYAMSRKLYGEDAQECILGVRLHTSIELIDRYSASSDFSRDRYCLYSLERATIDLAEVVLTPTKTYYEKQYGPAYGLDRAKVVVSKPPDSSFGRVRRRPDRHGPFSIVYFGRLAQFKGVDQLVHAVVELLERHGELPLTLELVGPEAAEAPFAIPYVEYLRTLVPAALRDRVVFRGHLSHEETLQLLDRVLFAVFPNRVESFCYSVHEVHAAGVPVIVNRLPGFAEFFHHEQNALVYDGTTRGLVDAMERLLSDDVLRERLAGPRPVAGSPLGEYYGQPLALSPLRWFGETPPHAVQGVIVVLARHTREATRRTFDALGAQTDRSFDVICLAESEPGDDETSWWLGARWRVQGPEGNPLAVTRVVTREALAIIESGDRPEPSWFARSARVLSEHPRLAFSGTWPRRDGRLVPWSLDIAPELHPFEHGCTLTRTLIRTEPGLPLADVLDPDLGPLGEVGLLWKTVAQQGPGCLLPVPLIDIAPDASPPLDQNLLGFLLARYGGPFAGRLSLIPALFQHRPPTGSTEPLLPTLEERIRAANQLDGRTLIRLALRKLKTKLTPVWKRLTPPGHG